MSLFRAAFAELHSNFNEHYFVWIDLVTCRVFFFSSGTHLKNNFIIIEKKLRKQTLFCAMFLERIITCEAF